MRSVGRTDSADPACMPNLVALDNSLLDSGCCMLTDNQVDSVVADTPGVHLCIAEVLAPPSALIQQQNSSS